MPSDDAIKFGILKCRDLVELYYGVRMVTDVKETVISFDGGLSAQILNQDPRRIRYEIVLANEDVATQEFDLSSITGGSNNLVTAYSVAPGSTLVIERSFLSDLDSVTKQVWCAISVNTQLVSVRETFLTPAPVDEIP